MPLQPHAGCSSEQAPLDVKTGTETIRRTFNRNLPTPKSPRLHMQHITVICDHDWHNGHLRLHSKMESALFERQHIRLGGVGAGAFGEDVDALALGIHHCGRGGECCTSIGAIAAVDEDCFAEGHCVIRGLATRVRGKIRLWVDELGGRHVLNWPSKGVHLSERFAVTLQ